MTKQRARSGGFDFGGFDFGQPTMFFSPEGDPAGGGEGGGSGGGEGGGTGGGEGFTPPDLSNPQVKAWFEEQTQPLVQNRDKILQEKREIEQQFKGIKSKLDPFGGDVDKAVEVMSKVEDSELKDLLKEGKFDDFKQKVNDSVAKQYQRKLKEYEDAVKERDDRLSGYDEKLKSLTIDREITELAAKNNVHASALEDLKNRARNVFSLDNDSMKVVAIDPETQLPMNMTPESWIEDLKESAPHFFPASTGTGSKGSPGVDGRGRKVIRLPEGYKQSDFERANKEAEETGAIVKLPGEK